MRKQQKTIGIFLTILNVLLIGGCSMKPQINKNGLALNAVTIPADKKALKADAMRYFKTQHINIHPDQKYQLEMSEKNSRTIESRTRLGTVGKYNLEYTLFFSLISNEGLSLHKNKVTYKQVILHDESSFKAKKQEYDEAVSSMRSEALKQMLYILSTYISALNE